MELARNWCLHSGPPRAALLQEGPLRTTHVQLLRHWRRLAAELAEVMACLHGKNPPIVYRDLKPDNVLMREGSDSQLHVCLTDFGYAKQPQFMHEMATPAGNFLTAAPEVPRPWEERRPYTQHVDNWSLGMTMLCMLWCTHEVYHNQQVPVKPERSLWEDEGDPRSLGWLWGVDAGKLVQHPVVRGIKPLEMLLLTSGHDLFGPFQSVRQSKSDSKMG